MNAASDKVRESSGPKERGKPSKSIEKPHLIMIIKSRAAQKLQEHSMESSKTT
jgi:hypothetical protein